MHSREHNVFHVSETNLSSLLFTLKSNTKYSFNDDSFKSFIQHCDSMIPPEHSFFALNVLKNNALPNLFNCLNSDDFNKFAFTFHYANEINILRSIFTSPTTFLLCSIYLPEKVDSLFANLPNKPEPSWRNYIEHKTLEKTLCNLSSDELKFTTDTLFKYYTLTHPNIYLDKLDHVPKICYEYYFSIVFYFANTNPEWLDLIFDTDEVIQHHLYNSLIPALHNQFFDLHNLGYFNLFDLFKFQELASIAFKNGDDYFLKFCDIPKMISQYPDKFIY